MARERIVVATRGEWRDLSQVVCLARDDVAAADEIEDLSRRLGFIQHVDEPDRLRSYRDVLAAAIAGQPHAWTDHERRRLLMLESQLDSPAPP